MQREWIVNLLGPKRNAFVDTGSLSFFQEGSKAKRYCSCISSLDAVNENSYFKVYSTQNGF